MFTGIVEGVGRIGRITECDNAWRYEFTAPMEIAASLAVGDSLACNGCCLTVVAKDGETLAFDLLEESLRLTNHGEASVGDVINLERALAANARLGGHFVSGHVDALGEVVQFEEIGKNYYLKVGVPEGFTKYLVYKGSIAIDGISLTVAEAHEDGFAVWLIPHTLEVTNLGTRKVGQKVNLEFDLLAKYVEKLMVNG